MVFTYDPYRNIHRLYFAQISDGICWTLSWLCRYFYYCNLFYLFFKKEKDDQIRFAKEIVLMLLIAVASGLVGKFLLKRANDTLKDKITELINSGMQRSDAEKKLFMDSIAVDMMKKWRVVHLPITIILGVLSLLHILSIIIFTS